MSYIVIPVSVVVGIVLLIAIYTFFDARKIKKNILEAEVKFELEKKQFKDEIQKKESAFFEERKSIEKREEELTKLNNKIILSMNEIEEKKYEYENELEVLERAKEQFAKQREEELLAINNLSREEAKDKLFSMLKSANEHDFAKEVKLHKEELARNKKIIATDILLKTMENLSGDLTTESTLQTIDIASEDIKGKLIGREGRNIKTLETLLGVNVIIDDSPGVISISSFNPIRREIASQVITNLIIKGRINQTTIENEFVKVSSDIKEYILQKGRDIAEKFKIFDYHEEILENLGKLEFRSSYGQNILQHSIETANIAVAIANELQINPIAAARCALIHDIGKVDSHELGKSHIELGMKLAQKCSEKDYVINAIEAHHGDVEPETVYAVITIIADRLSAARPGSRRIMFDNYLERITSLEKLVENMPGVQKGYALQGGREIRVIVETETVTEDQMIILANEIKEKVEHKIDFPGAIRVNVIRESRVVLDATKSNTKKRGDDE
ncbi:MAG: ribonuclease Y [Mycoplasmatales bacterium]